MCTEALISNTSAYGRKSTNFIAYLLYMGYASKGFLGMINKLCEYMHYGIDIPKRLSLPIPGKKHLLFFSLGEIEGSNRTVVKWEGAGLRGAEAIKHTLDLIKKKVLQDIILSTINDLKKQFESTLAKGSVIRKELEGIKLVDTTSAGSKFRYRREGTPAKIMIQYLALLLSPENRLSKAERKNYIKGAKALGIKSIVNQSKYLARYYKITTKLRAAFEKLAVEIMKEYPDFNDRFGNEVILFWDDVPL